MSGRRSSGREPWVIVAGGFHRRGGMDKANLALVDRLLAEDAPVHLVAHAVDPDVASRPGVHVHLVRRPLGSILLGEWPLGWSGHAVARSVRASDPRARVVVNGGNCSFPDINWVHSVHRAWPTYDRGAPPLFRAKNRLTKAIARHRERRALRVARLVIANSERTVRDAIAAGADASRVRLLYLGADPAQGAPSAAERATARRTYGVRDAQPVVIFAGALSHDRNKGLDTLLDAWRSLCGDPSWDATLLVAGGGGAVASWEAVVRERGLAGRVRLLGFVDGIETLLAAADLLVSPVRYEAYGLNVQEAICRGVPAIVSRQAGVSERYGPDLEPLLLDDPESVGELADALRRWRAEPDGWRARFAPLGERLRAWSWDRMASAFLALADDAREPSTETGRRAV